METVCVKFEEPSLKEIEKAMAKNHYVTKAEFIREAVREKLVDLEKREALRRLEQVYGAGAKKGRVITDEDIHRAGEEAAKEIAHKLGVEL